MHQLVNHKYFFVILLFLIIGIGITVFLSQRSTDFRQRAAGTTFTNPPNTYFPYGAFDDMGVVGGASVFRTMLTDLKSRGMDAVFLTNGFGKYEGATLDVSDQIGGMNIFLGPQGELNSDWWPDTVPTNITTARNVIYPLVDMLKTHPSLKGYAIKDDAASSINPKLLLAYQAFNERDNTRPVMPTLVGAVFDPNQGVYTTYWHPVKVVLPACNLNSNNIDFAHWIDALQQNNRLADRDIPLWNMAAQAYGPLKTYDPSHANPSALREPSAEEVRLQHWLNIAAGVKGIIWMTYSDHPYGGTSDPAWIGFKNNPALLAEITDLTRRINPLRPLLLNLNRDYNEKFTVTASDTTLPVDNKPSVASLITKDNGKYYVAVVNKSCSSQTLSVRSIFTSGQLKDVETGQVYNFGNQLSFRGGEGKLFEVINASSPPTPTLAPNLLVNGSFEDPTGGFGLRSSSSIDSTVSHTGSKSYKAVGPASLTYTWQAPTLKPNTQYSISLWIKTQNVTGRGVSARYPETSPSTYIHELPFANGTSDWKQVIYTFYTRTNFQSGRFDLVWELNSGDIAWFDDVVLCEGPLGCNGTFPLPPLANPSPTPTPTPLPSPTPTPTGIIGIPKVDPNYGEDVETWWANHPMNPASPNGIPIGGIESPSPQVNVQQEFNSDIQAAINALPATGGTLFFEPGTYQHNFTLVGKSNIHFISSGGATILGGRPQDTGHPTDPFGTIATCPQAADYDGFIDKITIKSDPLYQATVDCAMNRKGNIYFKNLIFDGQNTAISALRLAATRDIVFDNVTFQNFIKELPHYAPVIGHEIINNVWFRNVTFRPTGIYAIYMDGLHGGGVINSRVESGFNSGNFLILTNDDVTRDLNNDGVYDAEEQRISDYIVLQGNTIATGDSVVAATAGHVLIKNNTTGGVNRLAIFDTRHATDKPVIYTYYGSKILNNVTQEVYVNYIEFRSLLPASGTCSPYCGKLGKYTIKDNVITNAPRMQN
ncbi:MAG: carbohydrate binding domain-containing protein, partial [Candidatus Levybacteria bacterium]|nr:carbohydrate binding domain-containing protein [Candidatus Levybacteria bacterium]